MAADASNCSPAVGTLTEQATRGAHTELEAQLATRLTSLLEARLQRAICAVTAHLEAIVERQVREAHDGIAARIEDVTAAHIDRARSALIPPVQPSSGSNGGRDEEELAARRKELAAVGADCEATRKRQDELEAIVTRIATTTARDHAASRAEVASELRGLGGGIRLALDRVESELAELKQACDEDRAAASEGQQQMMDRFRAEFASCDLVTSRLEDLRSWTTTELEELRRATAVASVSSGVAAAKHPPPALLSGLGTTHVSEDPHGFRQVPAPRDGLWDNLQSSRASVGHANLVASSSTEAKQDAEPLPHNLHVEEIDVEALEAHVSYSDGAFPTQIDAKPVPTTAIAATSWDHKRSSTLWLPDTSAAPDSTKEHLNSTPLGGYPENSSIASSLAAHCQGEVHERRDARAEHLQVQQARAEGGTGGAQGYSGAVA